MRLLNYKESASVIGGVCPLCVSSGAYLLAGTYASVTGYTTKNTFFYMLSTAFFSFSAFYLGKYLLGIMDERCTKESELSIH